MAFTWKKTRALSSLFAAVLAGTAMTAVAPMAFAQDKPVEGRQFGSKAGTKVNKALELMNAKQTQAALSELANALAIPDLNAFERSTIYQMEGQARYELNQYGAAITSFQNAINAGGLLPKDVLSTQFSIAQLLIVDEQFARGAQAMEDWNRAGGVLKDSNIELLWQAWSQAEQYNRALPWAQKWFNNARPKERRHFDTLNFMYTQLNMPGKQADILKEMIMRWPEDLNLWRVWQSLLQQGGRSDEAFEVAKLLYLGGAANEESDILQLIQYYSSYEMPYQAAQIMRRELAAGRIPKTAENLSALSNHLRQAREYKAAIPVLVEATKLTKKSKLFADLGEAYLKENQCNEAEEAFKEAMNRGYDRGKSWSIVANCRYEDAVLEEPIKCPLTEEKRSLAWFTKRDRAIAAYDNVPAGNRESKGAKTWQRFIRGEKRDIEARCEFELNVARDRCYIAIRRAYSQMVFTGGQFKLDQNAQHCMSYKPAYDEKFRPSATKEEG